MVPFIIFGAGLGTTHRRSLVVGEGYVKLIPTTALKETWTSFSFYFPHTTDDMYLSYPKLQITWSPYLEANRSDILWRNGNGGDWSSQVATFYANAIVADMDIRE